MPPRPPLLTVKNYKLEKSRASNYTTVGLSLSPWVESVSAGGHNMCSNAGACAESCLRFAGRNTTKQAKAARVRRTLSFISDFDAFVSQASHEITAKARSIARSNAKGGKDERLCVRPNILSDQPGLARALARRHPDIDFYDYTKIPKPWRRQLDNYRLTYSLDSHNHAEARDALDNGVNVAVVFALGRDDDLPAEWALPGSSTPVRVIDGDANDLRFLDPANVIVGLRFKGGRRAREEALASGFVFSPALIVARRAA